MDARYSLFHEKINIKIYAFIVMISFRVKAFSEHYFMILEVEKIIIIK